MTVNELISQIVLEYELQYNESDYNFDNEYKYDYSWVGYFNPLNTDKLFDQIPDDMALVIYKHQNNKPTLGIYLIGNIPHPLSDKFLYEVRLKKLDKEYTGLYNASENIWVIPPIKRGMLEDFHFIEGEEWIALDM
ncbi:MAG: hypothetical protein LBK74_05735 [Treponema sp.]|jgi:hypothetical protein|nr:hypothetical protein [Treponema sp.]